MTDKEPKKINPENAADLSAMLGMGGFLDGVSNLISKFGELAERGEHLRQSMGEAEVNGKPVRTSAGFTVRFGGLKGEEGESAAVPPIRPANAPRSTATNKSDKAPVVPKVREANVEVFEEEDHMLLLAEMPGVASNDVQLSFEGKMLSIQGRSQTAEFKANLELPQAYTEDQVAISANNGVIEIRLNNQP